MALHKMGYRCRTSPALARKSPQAAGLASAHASSHGYIPRGRIRSPDERFLTVRRQRSVCYVHESRGGAQASAAKAGYCTATGLQRTRRCAFSLLMARSVGLP